MDIEVGDKVRYKYRTEKSYDRGVTFEVLHINEYGALCIKPINIIYKRKVSRFELPEVLDKSTE